jgi:hypothetical protein
MRVIYVMKYTLQRVPIDHWLDHYPYTLMYTLLEFKF